MKNNRMMWILAIVILALTAIMTEEFGTPTATYNCTVAANGGYNCVLTGGTR